ncbi:MAG TPA: 6-phosphogluconolactonase [Deltaproteobacteria bacterium]|nr:6-phosphogluconolactonase [Deltaproteobacteria bacterium]
MLITIEGKDQDLLMQKTARQLCEKLRGALAAKARVNVAVCGGRNVAKIFEQMQKEEVEWQRVHFFIIDERLVPIDHPDSNYKLLRDYFIDPLARAGRIAAENAHPFLLDAAREDQGAAQYEGVLAEYGMRYDVILLSAGEDGHVGALYPNHHSIADSHYGFIVMHDSPKPPPDRMTSSLSLMQSADIALILFVGEAKREAYNRFQDEQCSVVACPARLVLALKDATVITDLN